MRILFGLFLLFYVSTISAQINKVSQGQMITAEQFNKIIDQLIPIGTIFSSILTAEQFVFINGDCWRLMNGGSLTGTDLGMLTSKTNLPDSVTEGTFLRQAKNGRELGSFQNDALQQHNHKVYSTVASGTVSSSRTPPEPGNAAVYSSTFTRVNTPTDVYAGEELQVGSNPLKTDPLETRSKNTAVNFFIKVNKQCNL